MTIYQPYTYLIGWSNLNIYYYGVRYAKNCNPKDLWVTYFTSSKHVKRFAEMNGSPDIIQIRKIFNDAKSAILWEEKVLKRMNVLYREDFLNKNISGAILLTDEMKLKISSANKGHKRKHTSETIQKMKGPKTEDHKKSMSLAKQRDIEKSRLIARKNGAIAAEKARGKTPPKDVVKRRAEGKIGLKYQKVVCPYCKKEVANNTLKRWHGENCKSCPQ